jgi:uncharacterized protein
LKYILLYLIKLYQAFFPKKYRGRCLFKESCSNYVYRKTLEEGLKSGLSSLRFRMKNCRPNYIITYDKNKILLITKNNIVIEEDEIDKRIIENARNNDL